MTEQEETEFWTSFGFPVVNSKPVKGVTTHE